MTKVDLELPPKLIPVFATDNIDIRGAYGGRGSAKTRSFAKMTAVRALKWATAGREGIILCGRKYMNSLDESSLEEVKAAICSEEWLEERFDIGEKYVRTKDRRVSYKFAGLDRNVDSIKSKSRILLCWVDEAEPVSEVAWQKLIPTLREEDSELWVTWNPENEKSATHKRFRIFKDSRMIVVELNYRDNPWFPKTLERTRLKDLKARPESYPHIWEGAFQINSQARVFSNFKVEEFTTPKSARFFFGVDFGFAKDPTTANRMWMRGNKLYIDQEVHGHGVPTEQLPALLAGSDLNSPPRWRNPKGYRGIDEIQKWPLIGDSSRPETIDHLKRNGFPRIEGSIKGAGSVEDGVEFLRGFDIIIHPRCVYTAQEFAVYSYKVDKQTEEVLPIIVDAHNHHIDDIRYALEKTRRANRMERKKIIGMH